MINPGFCISVRSDAAQDKHMHSFYDARDARDARDAGDARDARESHHHISLGMSGLAIKLSLGSTKRHVRAFTYPSYKAH